MVDDLLIYLYTIYRVIQSTVMHGGLYSGCTSVREQRELLDATGAVSHS